MLPASIWERIAELDESCVHAHIELAVHQVIGALVARDEGRNEASDLANAALAAVHKRLTLLSIPAPASMYEERWKAMGADYVPRIAALLHLDCALLLDFCGAVDEHGHRASWHYERAAMLDGSDRRMWQLWASSTARDESFGGEAARMQAASDVHNRAVQRGMWARTDQRPLQLVPALIASAEPWLDAAVHPACVALASHYTEIQREALSLLSGDGSVFESSRDTASVRGLASLSSGSGGLALPGDHSTSSGTWRDLSLLVNGRYHERHAALAPLTMALLCGEEGGLRRDSASCVYGSAFFSLLGPRTRLRPHCGPTNVRLRAHLALRVPPGDCAMRVGMSGGRGTPPGANVRKWVEGEVCLFDDSFEHEVWNETDSSRLVLIVDLWHPLLDTDEKRIATLDPDRAARYRRIVNDATFESAIPVQQQQNCRTRTKPTGITRLLAGLHEQLLGVAGVRRLLDCLQATAASEPAEDAAGRAQIEQHLRSLIEPPAVAIATAVPI